MTLAGTQDRKKLVRECGYPLTARVAIDRDLYRPWGARAC